MEKSRWPFTTGFSSLVVVKIKLWPGRNWKSFHFKTLDTKRKLAWNAKQVSLAAGFVGGMSSELYVYIILQRYSETSVEMSGVFLAWVREC